MVAMNFAVTGFLENTKCIVFFGSGFPAPIVLIRGWKPLPQLSFLVIQNRKPGRLGQVRDDRLCHGSNLFMGFPPEADQVSGVRKSMIYELRDLGIEKFVYR
jgi:hypothetical protein